VRLLLDTHAFLWYVLDDQQLTAKARALISDSNNEINVSPASYWEIAIKISVGKYSLSEPLDAFIDREMAANDLQILHIAPQHAAIVSTMPFHHRDPFDRLIVAQAIVEQTPIISGDPVLDAYGVTRLWS
jgi:PIN domain nuclease of toxin-antitoxin system